jgi:predicted kinase
MGEDGDLSGLDITSDEIRRELMRVPDRRKDPRGEPKGTILLRG